MKRYVMACIVALPVVAVGMAIVTAIHPAPVGFYVGQLASVAAGILGAGALGYFKRV